MTSSLPKIGNFEISSINDYDKFRESGEAIIATHVATFADDPQLEIINVDLKEKFKKKETEDVK